MGNPTFRHVSKSRAAVKQEIRYGVEKMSSAITILCAAEQKKQTALKHFFVLPDRKKVKREALGIKR